jgi:hypothetical protein
MPSNKPLNLDPAAETFGYHRETNLAAGSQLIGKPSSGPNMLSFDDKRWEGLKAGYRIPVDLRPLLRDLESGEDAKSTWEEIWQELYHQGDVGEGSFVAVPHLVRIHRIRGAVDWNTYAVVTTVELARGVGGNPDVPRWARESYDEALRELGRLGLEDLPRAQDKEAVRAILAFLAVLHGCRTHGRVMSEFSEDEVLELEKAAFGDPNDDEP